MPKISNSLVSNPHICYNKRLQSSIPRLRFKLNWGNNNNDDSTASRTVSPTKAKNIIKEKGKGFRHSTSPSGLPIHKIFSNSFPLSIRESFEHYSTRGKLDLIQQKLISTCLDSSIPFEIIKTEVNSKGEYINELYIAPTEKSTDDKHVVMIHGYGAGLGFFIKNIEKLAKKRPNWHIHAIDLLGYGCSSRPDFPYHEPRSNYEFIEKWFVDSLETWYLKRGLEIQDNKREILTISHSMGAYFSTLLNIKNPNLFNKLILVSPAGIVQPRNPPSIPLWFDKLWNLNVSPFVLVRKSGPLGSMFTSGWTSRRFSKDDTVLNKDEQAAMHLYSYAIFNAKGSGEYMLNYLLGPGGVPRNELINRVAKLQCDSTWMYGSHDWMNIDGGFRAKEMLTNKGLNCDVLEVSDSGHHLYLDNFKDFNDLIINEMDSLNLKKK